jgi:hypothetical protein
MTVQYTKAVETDVAVVELARVMNATPKEVVAVINQQRYRTAYNKLNMERMKVARRIMREHPELVKEGAK